mmetsp:Transcript_53741/g.98734  ORF Transcript_53741/g.98734 Transcript_53741/m.98734 type:complete len:261 (+) Transcript_53741:287-1069(+)
MDPSGPVMKLGGGRPMCGLCAPSDKPVAPGGFWSMALLAKLGPVGVARAPLLEDGAVCASGGGASGPPTRGDLSSGDSARRLRCLRRWRSGSCVSSVEPWLWRRCLLEPSFAVGLPLRRLRRSLPDERSRTGDRSLERDRSLAGVSGRLSTPRLRPSEDGRSWLFFRFFSLWRRSRFRLSDLLGCRLLLPFSGSSAFCARGECFAEDSAGSFESDSRLERFADAMGAFKSASRRFSASTSLIGGRLEMVAAGRAESEVAF